MHLHCDEIYFKRNKPKYELPVALISKKMLRSSHFIAKGRMKVYTQVER